MKGSEKQIKWAEDIKERAINYTRNGLAFAKEHESKELKVWENILAQLEKGFAAAQDAKWIIDNRTQFDPQQISNMVARMSR
jgi:hypothetical protein